MGWCAGLTLATIAALLVGFVYQLDDIDAGVRRYWPKPTLTLDNIPDFTTGVAIVTGGNAGIGLSTARILAQRNCKVIIGCRSMASCNKAAEQIRSQGGREVIPLELELSDSRSIFNFANQFLKLNLPLHVLIMNAGVMAIPEYKTTKDGLEMQTGVNWIGHFYLQQLLQSKIEASAPRPVIIVSAKAHELIRTPPPSLEALVRDGPVSRAEYNLVLNYALSKTLNIVHANELAERMTAERKNVTVISLHPGVIDTELSRSVMDWLGERLGHEVVKSIRDRVMGFLLLTADEGALTQLYAATSPEVSRQGLHGKYLRPMGRIASLSPVASDKAFQKQAWREGLKIIESFPRKD